MKEIANKKDILNYSSLTALILSVVCVASSLCSFGLSKITGMPTSIQMILSFVIWLVKFVGCIWIMKYFMARLVSDFVKVTNKMTFKLGIYASFFSAILIGVYTLLHIQVIITPEVYEESFIQAIGPTYSMLDSNSQKALNDLIPELSTISMISTFLYCFIYGVVLSSILSSRIPKADVFSEYLRKETENHGVKPETLEDDNKNENIEPQSQDNLDANKSEDNN